MLLCARHTEAAHICMLTVRQWTIAHSLTLPASSLPLPSGTPSMHMHAYLTTGAMLMHTQHIACPHRDGGSCPEAHRSVHCVPVCMPCEHTCMKIHTVTRSCQICFLDASTPRVIKRANTKA